MTTDQVHRSLVIASILFGAIVAVLAVVDADFMPVFAAVGGVVLGALWAINGYVRHQRSGTARTR